MSKTNETRFISWHDTRTCKCRLDSSVCNDRHGCNRDKCRCEYKELIDKGRCNDWFIYGILVHVNVNMINNVMLVNT